MIVSAVKVDGMVLASSRGRFPQAAKVVEDSMLMMALLVQTPYKMPLSCKNSSKSFSQKVAFS